MYDPSTSLSSYTRRSGSREVKAEYEYGYFDTHLDDFYIEEQDTRIHNLLVNLVSPMRLEPEVQQTVEKFQVIAFLTVDINTFVREPMLLWTKFPVLDILTIIFYPYSSIYWST